MRRMNVGVIGCGRIFPAYVGNFQKVFGHLLDVRACADIDPAAAKARAEEYHIPHAYSPEELLADPEIEIVVNLTVPQAHHAVNMASLAAGKHVFAEKPLAVTLEEGKEVVAEAARRGLRLGGAADTFLGAGLQSCLAAILAGDIGVPLTANAYITMGVHAERYHQIGIGPMFDMGPYYLTALVALLGPAVRATGSAQIPFPEKSDPSQGEGAPKYKVQTPTVVSGVLDFANGCVSPVTTTTEAFGYWPRLEVYGTEGVLLANDPNMYTGTVTLHRKKGGPTELPQVGFAERGRGLGVAEMAYAIQTGTPHRANGELMYHVLDLMHAFHDASRTGAHVAVASRVEPPAPFDYATLRGADA